MTVQWVYCDVGAGKEPAVHQSPIFKFADKETNWCEPL